jgi:hypothetical protein
LVNSAVASQQIETDESPDRKQAPDEQEILDSRFVKIMLEIEKRYHNNAASQVHFKHDKIRIE